VLSITGRITWRQPTGRNSSLGFRVKNIVTHAEIALISCRVDDLVRLGLT
jgi:hypothetical protein